MKTQFVSLLSIGLLTVLLSCQQQEIASTNPQSKSSTGRNARYAGYPNNVSFDITADDYVDSPGNCRNYWAAKKADGNYKTLVTVSVSNFDGVSKTFEIKGYTAYPGSPSSYDAVSISGGYTTYSTSGYYWVIPAGSASYTLKFYANFGSSSGASETVWTVGLSSPYNLPANGCGDGTGDAINIVKKLN